VIVTAVVVAGGRGVRFGAPDKVLATLGGRTVLEYSLDAIQHADSIDQVVLVAGDHLIDRLPDRSGWSKLVATVPGGERRQDSVRNGLDAVPPGTRFVAVHDAARPFATPALFDACVNAAKKHGAAIAAIPVTDTLKRVSDDLIDATISRTGLWAAQTPQVFDAGLLRLAFQRAAEQHVEATDEARLFELLGFPVAVVTGSTTNLKVTHPEDLLLANAILQLQRHEQ
jgi:2-C-methyl-D-erythritol 4-phosphate cytidylyltransferase